MTNLEWLNSLSDAEFLYELEICFIQEYNSEFDNTLRQRFLCDTKNRQELHHKWLEYDRADIKRLSAVEFEYYFLSLKCSLSPCLLFFVGCPHTSGCEIRFKPSDENCLGCLSFWLEKKH